MVFSSENFGIYFSILIFIKLNDLYLILKKLEDFFCNNNKIVYFISLCKLFLFLLIIVHFASCLFFGVGKIQYLWFNQEESWVITHEQLDKDWTEQYLLCYYLMAAVIKKILSVNKLYRNKDIF